MKVRDLDNACVVDVDSASVSTAEINELEMLLKQKAYKKRVGLNLGNVTYLSHEFGKLLQDYEDKSKLSLFNLNNDSLLFLYIAKYDKSADIYLCEEDFREDKRSFVNRRFKVLNTA